MLLPTCRSGEGTGRARSWALTVIRGVLDDTIVVRDSASDSSFWGPLPDFWKNFVDARAHSYQACRVQRESGLPMDLCRRVANVD